jgi:hypothetical protein
LRELLFALGELLDRLVLFWRRLSCRSHVA